MPSWRAVSPVVLFRAGNRQSAGNYATFVVKDAAVAGTRLISFCRFYAISYRVFIISSFSPDVQQWLIRCHPFLMPQSQFEEIYAADQLPSQRGAATNTSNKPRRDVDIFIMVSTAQQTDCWRAIDLARFIMMVFVTNRRALQK